MIKLKRINIEEGLRSSYFYLDNLLRDMEKLKELDTYVETMLSSYPEDLAVSLSYQLISEFYDLSSCNRDKIAKKILGDEDLVYETLDIPVGYSFSDNYEGEYKRFLHRCQLTTTEFEHRGSYLHFPCFIAHPGWREYLEVPPYVYMRVYIKRDILEKYLSRYNKYSWSWVASCIEKKEIIPLGATFKYDPYWHNKIRGIQGYFSDFWNFNSEVSIDSFSAIVKRESLPVIAKYIKENIERDQILILDQIKNDLERNGFLSSGVSAKRKVDDLIKTLKNNEKKSI